MTEHYPYVFFGSEPLASLALEALRQAKYEPAAIIDDPKLPLEEQLLTIEEAQPTLLLVAGYGAILKRPVLDAVAGQVLNIHPSLLPAYRGPAPVVQAILDGVRETGVTLMEIDEKMDHGRIVAQERYPLHGNETPAELYEVLTKKGIGLFLDYVDEYVQETAELIPQNHLDASFTHFVKKEDGLLDLSQPADALERKIRAYQGWPRTWITWKGKRLLIDAAHLENGALRFDRVQPEGGKPMAMKDFLAGQRLGEAEFYTGLSHHS